MGSISISYVTYCKKIKANYIGLIDKRRRAKNVNFWIAKEKNYSEVRIKNPQWEILQQVTNNFIQDQHTFWTERTAVILKEFLHIHNPTLDKLKIC